MSILREIKDLILFFLTDKPLRELVFYAEDTASYRYFEGLLENLINERSLPVCYVTSDPSDPIFGRQTPLLKVFYINKLLAYFTSLIDSRVLIMTMPDLHCFHVKRSEKGTNHVYLFHNIGSSFPVINFGALFHYDTIFCSGPHHDREIRTQEKLYGLPEKVLVPFGYYAVEKVHDQYRDFVEKHPPLEHEHPRVLFAPSWGADSSLDRCGKEIVRVLLDAGCEVILRPHPMSRKKSPLVIEGITSEFSGQKGFVYEGDISDTNSFYTSHILITDWSGVAYEYAFGTERPVIFIDVPRKVVNDRYLELGYPPVDEALRERLGTVVSPERLTGLVDAVKRMEAEPERFVDSIRRSREEFLYNFGRSSEAGGEAIQRFMEGEGWTS